MCVCVHACVEWCLQVDRLSVYQHCDLPRQNSVYVYDSVCVCVCEREFILV